MPSVSQIVAIEARLPALLQASGHKVKAAASYHQYIGFISKGKRLIYLSAFQSSSAGYLTNGYWRTNALISICDGGDTYWGVEFAPATNKFAHLGGGF